MPALQAFRRETKIVILILLACILSSCTGVLDLDPSATATPLPSVQPTPYPQVEVRFDVLTPSANEKIILEVLGDVTGLALNPKRFEMNAVQANQASVTLQFSAGSVVKYRYRRQQGNSLSIEYTSAGSQVRYRAVKVNTPLLIQDYISGWNDDLYDVEAGWIKGRVFDKDTNAPLPGILIAAGGAQSFSSSDGSYWLQGLPKGTHNLIAIDPSGKYSVFQQGALVDINATTPADLPLRKLPIVHVTLNVTIPEMNIRDIPVRITGNLSSLGNIAADLRGGMNVVAARTQLLTHVEGNLYSLTLSLPVGLDLRYKYTLGDGFWNAEHALDGSFVTRQLIVPDHDIILNDIVATWHSGDSQPVSFTLSVPDATPASDSLSIQFNPFGWTEPIPMWSLGSNHWTYVLYSPLDMLGTVGYRYCRNGQCGTADDSVTSGTMAAGYPLNTSLIAQDFHDDVLNWNWLSDRETESITASEVSIRGTDFYVGVEIHSRYHPLDLSYMKSGLDRLVEIGAKQVVLRPTWSYVPGKNPMITVVPSQDSTWEDNIKQIELVKSAYLEPILYPGLHAIDKLQTSDLTENWWNIWFSQYERYLHNFADLAEQNHIGMLIIGGPEITQFLPGGKLAQENQASIPEDISQRWISLVSGIRERFHGKILWAMEFPNDLKAPPAWLDQTDGIYLLWSSRLTKTESYDIQTMIKNLSSQLDNSVKPMVDTFEIPVFIAAGYPAAEGAVQACVKAAENSCYDFSLFESPAPELDNVRFSEQQQADVYRAFYEAINSRDWVSGFFSRGYNLSVELRDPSMSIRGKTAEDLLWYWFSKVR